MAENSGSPLFANRYIFVESEDTFDHGRSGITRLVKNKDTGLLGVIKSAQVGTKEAENLKNEIGALKVLKGANTPKIYETGKTVFNSIDYDYLVIEYLDTINSPNIIRVENSYRSLSKIERAEIITQLFGLLARAHKNGIVNGDVDLKHLFWRKDKKELVVIDWGNTTLGVSTNNITAFAFDLARSAGIIYSLVTKDGHPSAKAEKESIALPEDNLLISGLAPVPDAFKELCKWAKPSHPIEGSKAPYQASKLFKVSKEWNNALLNGKAYKADYQTKNKLARNLAIGLLFIFILLPAYFFVTNNWPSTTTPTPSVVTSPSKTPSLFPDTPTLTKSATLSAIFPSDEPTKTITPTLLPTSTPLPITYTPALIFNKELILTSFLANCWKNEAVPSVALKGKEGFYRRDDLEWGFKIDKERSIDTNIQADFSNCISSNQSIKAIALNAYVNRLESGQEFGIFVENQKGQRRDYTLWVDESRLMHLRVREDNEVVYDNIVLIVSTIDADRSYLQIYNKFPIQVYLDIGNQGVDTVYLLQGTTDPKLDEAEIIPTNMIPIEDAKLPTLINIQKLGLTGSGGNVQILIWPLMFLGN